jgi:hypothetical protein
MFHRLPHQSTTVIYDNVFIIGSKVMYMTVVVLMKIYLHAMEFGSIAQFHKWSISSKLHVGLK